MAGYRKDEFRTLEDLEEFKIRRKNEVKVMEAEVNKKTKLRKLLDCSTKF